MSFAWLAAGLLIAGCAADSPALQSVFVMGSEYDPLTCPDVVRKYKSADNRAKELAALREKSGSAIANALAYDTEYTTALANVRYAEQAAARKGCDLGNKPPAQPATAAAPAPPGPLELAPPGAAQAEPKK
jgi:hypothetical protein